MVSNVRIWAADELANRGAKETLPQIVEAVRKVYSGQRGEEYVRLCQAKIDLLNGYPSRLDALSRALVMADSTHEQRIRRWAIGELGKLDSPSSRSVLIGYALGLQDAFYDTDGRQINETAELPFNRAGTLYRAMIQILGDQGMTSEEVKQTGLRPEKLFRAAP
jgi:hypothetical protein